ncbi:hypothetical protein OUZ56_026969 [Daphnia magna]|uniref:Uncharacterized protein n=1 Tax=Daphnia magna TaxID=35525 RepID=A0ABQ9ZNI5_9CRUS|nr:hypothetical protein OUZ56_026969 [Daphnia magna]
MNRNDVHFLDVIAHKTLLHYSYLEVISTRKGQTYEISLLVRQLTIQQRIRQQNVLKRKLIEQMPTTTISMQDEC